MLSGAAHDAAVILRREGWTDTRIGEAFSISAGTVRDWRKRHGFTGLNSRYKPKINDEEALSLYQAGHTDPEIAEHFGATQSGVARWRYRNILPAHNEQNAKVSEEIERKARKLLRQGYTRRQVADEIGYGIHTVQRIRDRIGPDPRLHPSHVTLQSAKSAALKSSEKILARITKAVGKLLPPDIVADAIGDIYLACIEGKMHVDQIEQEAKKYANRVLNNFASRWGPKSLDEEIGEDGFKLMDLLEDKSALDPFEEILESADW
jgi:transposase